MKRIVIVIVLVVVFALVSNPGFEKHQSKINEKFAQENPIAGSLGGGRLYSGLVKYKDFYVFSYTSRNQEVVSVGFFSLVLVIKDIDVMK